jgi:hypothetical protein
MNYHFKKQVTDPNLQEKFKAYFKKSDFDFNVNIDTTTDDRFNVLKKYTYPVIIKFLKKTTDLFNHYLTDVLNDKQINPISNENFLINFHDKKMDNEFQTIYDRAKKIIHEPRFILMQKIVSNGNDITSIKSVKTYGSTIIVDAHPNPITFQSNNPLFSELDNPEIISDMNSLLGKYLTFSAEIKSFYEKVYSKSKYHAIQIYPYYRFLVKPIPVHEMEWCAYLKQLIEYNFALIQKSSFYTKQKIEALPQ